MASGSSPTLPGSEIQISAACAGAGGRSVLYWAGEFSVRRFARRRNRFAGTGFRAVPGDPGTFGAHRAAAGGRDRRRAVAAAGGAAVGRAAAGWTRVVARGRVRRSPHRVVYRIAADRDS